MKDWLTILVSLLDEVAVTALILVILWIVGIPISLPIILGIVAFFGIDVFIMHKLVLPALRRRKVTGVEGMVGMKAKVIEELNPVGLVSVGGELWKAESISGHVRKNETVEIVGSEGLSLKVKSNAGS